MWDGSNTGGAKKQKRYYYQCPDHRNSLCDTKDINAEYIENFVVDLVIQSLKHMDIEDSLNKSVDKDICFENTAKNRNEKHIRRRNEELIKLNVRLLDADIKPTLRENLEENSNNLAVEIKEYKNKVQEQEEYISILQTFKKLENFSKEELLSDRIQARDFIKGIIKGIFVNNGDINIKL